MFEFADIPVAKTHRDIMFFHTNPNFQAINPVNFIINILAKNDFSYLDNSY